MAGGPGTKHPVAYTGAMTRSEVALALKAFFEADSRGAEAVYLFGSVAGDAAGPDSDVDVGVLLTRRPESTLAGQPFDLADTLERLLGRRVDLVVLNTAPADLRIRVLRNGHLVFESEPSARVRFEVATRNEFFDLEPILSRYRRPRVTA
jgi:predicted nucleotidyltransferase